MKLIPVIDILDGQVVRGIAGDRQNYRPVISILTKSSHPLDVARSFHEHFGFRKFYVADLDAIAGKNPALTIYQILLNQNYELLVDAGIRETRDAKPILSVGVQYIIAGLESLQGPRVLLDLVNNLGEEKLLFSLDLRQGHTLRGGYWESCEPLEIAKIAFSSGIRRFIVLDLAGVGMTTGVKTLKLCQTLKIEMPFVEIITGGGVRGPEDLKALEIAKIDGVLIASAFHDGKLTRENVAKWL